MLGAIRSGRLTWWGERLSLSMANGQRRVSWEQYWDSFFLFVLPPASTLFSIVPSPPPREEWRMDRRKYLGRVSQFTFSISMQSLHFIQLTPEKRTSLPWAMHKDSLWWFCFHFCPDLWTSLYRVVCVYSYFTLSTTEHYFILSLIHPCRFRPTDFENDGTLLRSSHPSVMFFPVHDLQACDLPRVAKKLIISTHHFLLGYNSHQRIVAFLWTY